MSNNYEALQNVGAFLFVAVTTMKQLYLFSA